MILGIFSAALLAAAWIARRKKQTIPVFQTWQQGLAKGHGSKKAQALGDAAWRRYTSLLALRPLPANPALRRHVRDRILPGLALYQALQEEHDGDQQAALAELDLLFRDWALREYRWMKLLKVLPLPFGLFRIAANQRMKEFPAEGWDMEYVEKSWERFAFNATRCFYLNTLTAYGAPELTPHFCTIDDIMAEMLPPSVRFVRTKTLGRGDELCDFQYCRA